MRFSFRKTYRRAKRRFSRSYGSMRTILRRTKRRKSSSKGLKFMKKKIMGIPLWMLLVVPVVLYYTVPSFTIWVDKKILKKTY